MIKPPQYEAHCLNCGEDYTVNVHSSHCPHKSVDHPDEVARAEKYAEKLARREADPMCVCKHPLSQHEDSLARFPNGDLVLNCTAEFCACGPGCIHEGFVSKTGLGIVPNAPRRKPTIAELDAILNDPEAG